MLSWILFVLWTFDGETDMKGRQSFYSYPLSLRQTNKMDSTGYVVSKSHKKFIEANQQKNL